MTAPTSAGSARRETGFTMDASSIKFGPGMTREVGYEAARLGCRRVLLGTDPRVKALPPVQVAAESLAAAGIDVVIYDGARTEPTDGSFNEAIGIATDGKFDGYVAVGGGSVIDTAKAANLYATYPADLLAQPARAPQSGNWDAGRVRHLLPAASDTRFLIKASFTQPLASTPAPRIGNRSVTGWMTDTAGEFWQFFVDGLLPGRPDRLSLRASGMSLCEPWEGV